MTAEKVSFSEPETLASRPAEKISLSLLASETVPKNIISTVSCENFVSKCGSLQTDMIIQQRRSANNRKVMVISLIQSCKSSKKVFSVEFTHGRSDYIAVKAKIWLPGQQTRFFDHIPVGNKSSSGKLPQKQLAWQAIQSFIDRGSDGLQSFFPGIPSEINVADKRQRSLLSSSRFYHQPALSTQLYPHIIASFCDYERKITINLIHNSHSFGDQIKFIVPDLTPDAIRKKVMMRFFEDLLSDQKKQQQEAFSNLIDFTQMEKGQIEIEDGDRHSLALTLYDNLSPSLVDIIEDWRKVGAPLGASEFFEFLRYGLEFELIRRRNPTTQIFSEMLLALSPDFNSSHNYFILRNSTSCSLRFNLPAVGSRQAWQTLLSSLVRAFAYSPEALVESYSHWIDPKYGQPFPIKDRSLRAYRHVVHLFQASKKTLDKELQFEGSIESDFSFKMGAFNVNFIRSSCEANSRNLKLSFKVTEGGVETISLFQKSAFLSRSKRFVFKPGSLDNSHYAKIFSAFYRNGFDKKLRNTRIFRCLLAIWNHNASGVTSIRSSLLEKLKKHPQQLN